MVLESERVGTTRMCVLMGLEGSAVSKLPTQEKPNPFNRIVRPVKIPPVRFAVVESAPSGPDPCTPSGSPVGTRTTVQAVLVAFLAWAALLCAGLGGTVGAVSQTLAGKLAASAQHLQRPGGTSVASRAVRRELAAVAAELKVAEASAAVFELHVDGAVPAGGITLPMVARQSEAQAPALTQLRPDARHRTPPSRAPPLLA